MAKHKTSLMSEGFWNEKWQTNVHCRNKSSRLTPSVNQERGAVHSTLMWTPCLLWSVSKATPSFWYLNLSDHVWCGSVGCLKQAGCRIWPPRSSTLWLADGHKNWVHLFFKVFMKLKVDVQMKSRNKLLKGWETEKKRLSHFQLTHFFPGLVSTLHYSV